MTTQDIKNEISKVLDNFSDKALEELLSCLKELDKKNPSKKDITSFLDQIMKEDKALLNRLAQ